VAVLKILDACMRAPSEYLYTNLGTSVGSLSEIYIGDKNEVGFKILREGAERN
jgi:hypothetical protein